MYEAVPTGLDSNTVPHHDDLNFKHSKQTEARIAAHFSPGDLQVAVGTPAIGHAALRKSNSVTSAHRVTAATPVRRRSWKLLAAAAARQVALQTIHNLVFRSYYINAASTGRATRLGSCLQQLRRRRQPRQGHSETTTHGGRRHCTLTAGCMPCGGGRRRRRCLQPPPCSRRRRRSLRAHPLPQSCRAARTRTSP